MNIVENLKKMKANMTENIKLGDEIFGNFQSDDFKDIIDNFEETTNILADIVIDSERILDASDNLLQTLINPEDGDVKIEKVEEEK